jgi:hypothetical protein
MGGEAIPSSQLNYKTPLDCVAYTNVAIRRKDFRRIIRTYVEDAKQLRKRR